MTIGLELRIENVAQNTQFRIQGLGLEFGCQAKVEWLWYGQHHATLPGPPHMMMPERTVLGWVRHA